MAPRVPTVEPLAFTAGDHIAWTKDLRDFQPDDGWTLTYAFRGETGDGHLNITAANVANVHSLTIPGASSNLMHPGLWVWDSYATKAGERYRVSRGTVKVEPNLAAIDFSTDLRSPAKKAYDNALAAWESVKAGQSVSLNGRTYTQHNLKELIAYVDRCKSEYALELQYQDVATGGDPRHIFVRLKRE